jgi:hypothetical protein
MNAKDGRNNSARLDNAKEDMITIANANAGARFGIISLDTKPQVYMPMTTSFADLDVATKTLITKDQYTSRTDAPELSKLLTTATDYINKSKKVDSSREVIVVMLSDGEITSQDEDATKVLAAAQELQKVAKGGVFIGYGSDAGSNMPVINYVYSTNSYITKSETIKDYVNNKYGDVITKRDQQLMKDVSKQMKGNYVAAENTGDIDTALRAANKTAYAAQQSSAQGASIRQSIAYVPVALLFFGWLVVVELAQKTKFIVHKDRQK